MLFAHVSDCSSSKTLHLDHLLRILQGIAMATRSLAFSCSCLWEDMHNAGLKHSAGRGGREPQEHSEYNVEKRLNQFQTLYDEICAARCMPIINQEVCKQRLNNLNRAPGATYLCLQV